MRVLVEVRCARCRGKAGRMPIATLVASSDGPVLTYTPLRALMVKASEFESHTAWLNAMKAGTNRDAVEFATPGAVEIPFTIDMFAMIHPSGPPGCRDHGDVLLDEVALALLAAAVDRSADKPVIVMVDPPSTM